MSDHHCWSHVSIVTSVMSSHHSDQMSQRSQVSAVALCMSKVKVLGVSESVSQWVSQWQGHLLSCSGQLKIRTTEKYKFYLWRYTPVWMTMASATSSTSSLVSRSLPWNYRSTKWRWPLNLTRSNTLRHFPQKTLMNFFTSQVQIYRRNFISTALGAVI